MFNVGGGELLVILLIALIVLGPQKLPGVAKQVGGIMREVRKVSSGFQQELKSALDEPVEEAARDRGNRIVSSEQQPAPDADSVGSAAQDDTVSTAAAAGMYDAVPPDAEDEDETWDDDELAATDTEHSAPEPGPASAAEAAGMYDPEPGPAHDTGDDAAGNEADG